MDNQERYEIRRNGKRIPICPQCGREMEIIPMLAGDHIKCLCGRNWFECYNTA